MRTSYTIAIGAPEEMLAQARAASAFGTLKVKLGFDGDLELAQTLARALPETTFRYDANEGWSRERAAASLAVLAELGAELVEQPLPAADTDGAAWLSERTSVPLFADEAVLTIDDLDAVARIYDGVVVKLSKAGGIAGAFALISACAGRGLRVLLGCMVESSLGIAAGLQLAGLADHVDLDGALLLPTTRSPASPWRATCSPRRTSRGWGCGRRGSAAPVELRVASGRLHGAPRLALRPARAPRRARRPCATPPRNRRRRRS